MEKELLIAGMSSIFYFVGIFPYFRDTLSWKTLPHPFSYFVWCILTGFNTYVLFIQSEYIALFPAILNTISCIIFTYYGVKSYKKIQINTYDYIFLIGALGMFPFYFYTKDILLTVILSVVIDFLGYLPTLKKGWILPWAETLFTFFIIGIAQLLILFTQTDITLESSLFWVYAFVVNMFFVSIVCFRRWYLQGWKSIFH